MRPEWVQLAHTVQAGAAWLVDSKQPRGAMLTHHGIYNHVGGGLFVAFAPQGRLAGDNAGPEPDTVVILDLQPAYEGGPRPEPFTETEIDEVEALLVQAGLAVHDRWNGAGFSTGSYAVSCTLVSRTLAAAARRYHDGCPEPGHSVFCGPGGFGLGHEDCTWSEGFSKLVPPAWVEVPRQAPAPSQPTEDDSNLRAVKEALARLTPVLAEMGVHPGSVAAGRRGHIDGNVDLEFVEDQGHGVLIPAETAERLVAAAALAWQLGLHDHA